MAAAGVAFAAFSIPAHAETAKDDAASQSLSPSSSAGKPKTAKKYCVVGTITGSRVARKVCKTREEWEAEGIDITAL
jgi:hypothetical protein